MLLAAVSISAQVPSGRWEGTITIDGLKIPFTILLEGSGGELTGSFVNGDTRTASTSGSFEGGELRLSFAHAGTQLRATLENEELKGDYGGEKHGMHRFTASAYCTCSYEGETGPPIMGSWEVPEADWKLAVRRNRRRHSRGCLASGRRHRAHWPAGSMG